MTAPRRPRRWPTRLERRPTQAVGDEEPGANEGTGSPVDRVVVALTNATVIGALLIYFGWRRSETQAQLLGLDESVLGMSPQEYMLRSVGPVLVLLATISAGGLAWMLADACITRLLRRYPTRPLRQWLRRGLLIEWLVLPVLAWMIGLRWHALGFVAVPLALGAGLLLLLYREQIRAEADDASARSSALRGLVFLGAAICLFWSASNYAEIVGGRLAHDFAERVDQQVQVVVYSNEPLYLSASGVVAESLSNSPTAYRYRYSGLRLMDHIGNRYFLISAGWTSRRGVIIVLQDNDKVRFEFARG